MDTQTRNSRIEPQRSAWSVNEWGVALGVSRSWVYALMASDKSPKSARVGRRRLITESPASYIERCGTNVTGSA